MKNQFNKWFVIPFMLILIPISGCEKEDYTLPVEFNLNFAIKNEAILGGSITIDEISINLKSIDIRGYREQGDDVFLTRNFDQEKTFIIKPLPTNLTEKFNIPQGIYNPISFSFNFQPDDEESDLTEDIIDWLEGFEDGEELESLQEDLGGIIEDYLEEITPCIMVKGKFIYNSQTKPIIILINDPLTFQILGRNSNGGAEVILDKDIVNNGNLEINPSYWFSVITPAMLNDAFVGLINEDEYIFLSKYVNSQLYATIFNRMEVSTILTINE